jgi:FkbM family methyltransferase
VEFLRRSGVQLWNPFEVESLPLLAATFVRAYRRYPRRTLATALSKRAFRLLYKTLRSAGVGGRGRALYRRGGQVRPFGFNARNSQFESIYMPHYAGAYEPETLALLDALVGAQDVFYDIGSNWGHYTLHVASRPGFAGRIHAFEPFPSSFKDLEETVRQAGLQDMVVCHNFALSNARAERAMTMPDGIRSGLAALSSAPGGVPVATFRLDDLSLPPPAVMKVDVEGHEARVFEGGRKLLAAAAPLIVFESQASYENPAEVVKPLNVLEALGYVFFVPTLLLEKDGVVCALPSGVGERPHAALDLGLFRLRREARFLFGEQINILACPTSKLEQFASRFERVGHPGTKGD